MSNNKILIVDDDVDYVASMRVVLESAGHQVFSANNKAEGSEMLEKINPDLIILDVMMEKMADGFDLAREIRNIEKYKKTPILMATAVGQVTGFKFSPQTDNETWLPVDDYVEKPISPKDLIAKVEKLLS